MEEYSNLRGPIGDGMVSSVLVETGHQFVINNLKSEGSNPETLDVT